MAKHRTRQQKAKTQEHRGRVLAPAVATVQELQVERKQSYVVSSDKQQQDIARRKSALSEIKPSPIPPLRQSLLRVDQKYLEADLRRSVFVSIILFVVLIGIFWLVRYNGLATIMTGIAL